MSASAHKRDAAGEWQPQPLAAELVSGILETFYGRCPALVSLASRLRAETGTRMIDWVDHLVVDASLVDFQVAEQAGFCSAGTGRDRRWQHPGGIFPQLRNAADTQHGPPGVAIRVESIEAYLAVHGRAAESFVQGDPDSPYRQCDVTGSDAGDRLWVVERHGDAGFCPQQLSASERAAIRECRQEFLQRVRGFPEPAAGFAETQRLIERARQRLPSGRVCDLFFAAERHYWEGRNRAARVQRTRQDRLGMGWANHDHHTYRSSRGSFRDLVATLELLGLTCRERFYAGAEAGWGAQVLEQEQAEVVVFADVDLAADEVSEDFSHRALPARKTLGTVGLWCLLHGELMLQAGMHHLECQFDFEAACAQLAAEGIATMPPFTDLPFLKQAFTVGERWPVVPQRIEAAVAGQLLEEEEAALFRAQGAIGSHLEILERNDGYRGFNQTGISQIIRRTDPRYQLPE